MNPSFEKYLFTILEFQQKMKQMIDKLKLTFQEQRNIATGHNLSTPTHVYVVALYNL